jgi:2-oxoisovalerate dehydrogenase E2 component (dihydrolipoyl transacylase)
MKRIFSLKSFNRRLHYNTPSLKIVPFLLADIGEGITECEIVAWHVKPGDKVEQFTKICEVQSDKAAVDITSRYDGVIKTIKYEVGQTAKVGTPLVEIDTLEVDSEATTPDEAPIPDTTADEASKVEKVKDIVEESLEKGYTLTTPSVRRIAKENNVNLKEIEGSGPKGRILKGDVLAYIEKLKSAVSEVDPKSISNEGVPLNGIQKAMYKSMTKSLSIPHFGYSEEIVLDALVNLRKDVNSSLGSIKLSYMPFFIKALSLSLVKYPILNTALLDDSSHSTAKLLYRKEHHVGVAMDTPGG